MGVTISFGERFAASDQFDAIFREGMALVERTAAYLDGPGRKEAKALAGPVGDALRQREHAADHAAAWSWRRG